MPRFLVLSALLISGTVTPVTRAQPTFAEGHDPTPAGASWVAVEELSDEFEGDAVDPTKWQVEPRANDWVWVGRPPALFRAENIAVVDGKLSVTVGKLDEPVTVDGQRYTHQGGIVRSLHPGQLGWYYECKMKANATEMSSTFWLMTNRRHHDAARQKKLEFDIQECVGATSELTEKWGRNWDEIFHANAIHRVNEFNPEPTRDQKGVKTPTKNHERYYVYGAWWKSPDELMLFLDGEHKYTLDPPVAWDVPAFLHMAIETYDWNPIPPDGGMVEAGTWEQRTTRYEWVRTWKPKEAGDGAGAGPVFPE